MRRSLSGLLALAAMPLFAVHVVAEEPAQPEQTVCTCVSILKLPAGFCERAGVLLEPGKGVTECQFLAIMERAKTEPKLHWEEFPKVTTCDGQSATVRDCVKHYFVTGIDAAKVDGQIVFVPKKTPVEIGDTLTLRGCISADQKYINLHAKLTRTTLNGEVVHAPVVAQVSPIFEGGSQGAPIPVTQLLEVPELKTRTVEKTVMVPSGGTMVLGKWSEPAAPRCGPPVLNKVPYINRLYKNVQSAECEVIVLATARVMKCDEPQCCPQTRIAPTLATPCVSQTCTLAAKQGIQAATAQPPVAPPVQACASDSPTQVPRVSLVRRLRNIAAIDAAEALQKWLPNNSTEAAVAVAEPASNTIILSGNRELVNKMNDILAKMDTAPPQVLIQAMIMEVPKGWLGDIGLGGEAGKPIVLTEREMAMFNAAIRHQKEKGGIDILSRPQIQVADNQTGYCQVGAHLPIVAGVEVMTRPEGGYTLTPKMSLHPGGVCLKVTPRLDPREATMLLNVEAQVSTVSDAGTIRVPLTVPPEITGLKEAVTYQVPTSGAINEQSTRIHLAGVHDGETVLMSAGMRKQKTIIQTASGQRKEHGETTRETLILLTVHRVKDEQARAAELAKEAAGFVPVVPTSSPAATMPPVMPAPTPVPQAITYPAVVPTPRPLPTSPVYVPPPPAPQPPATVPLPRR